MPSIGAGERQVGEQLRDTLIQNGPVIPTGAMAEC
jgi:hypothetical protein